MKSDSLRKNPKWINWMVCTGFMVLSPIHSMATNSVSEIQVSQQQQVIKGIVVDEAGEGIIGANVMVEGTKMGTITDFDGRFSLSIPKGSKIKVSFIGYKDQIVSRFSAGKELRIVMEDDSQLLSEVEVVAYGSQKKVSVTGAISSMKGEDLLKTPAASLSNILSGQVTGISSVQYSGEPGADAADLYVRGIATWNNASIRTR